MKKEGDRVSLYKKIVISCLLFITIMILIVMGIFYLRYVDMLKTLAPQKQVAQETEDLISKSMESDAFLLKKNGQVFEIQIENGKKILTPVSDESEMEGLLENRILLWHDEFNGEEIDTSKWEINNFKSKWGGDAYFSPDAVKVHDGIMTIEAEKSQQYDDASWITGGISTKGLHNFKYGRYEIKFKSDFVKGTNTAFWTCGSSYIGATDDNLKWPMSGEIDFFELQEGMKGRANLHYANFAMEHVQSPFAEFPDNLDTSEWHVYACEWTEKNMQVYFDGELLGEQDLETLNWNDLYDNMNPFKQSHFLQIMLGCGTNSCGGKMPDYYDNTVKKAKYQVDYVRVYGVKGADTEVVIPKHILLTDNGQNSRYNDSVVTIGDKVNLNISYDIPNCVIYDFIINTSDVNVAYIENNLLFANGIGECTITLESNMYNIKDSFQVKVTDCVDDLLDEKLDNIDFSNFNIWKSGEWSNSTGDYQFTRRKICTDTLIGVDTNNVYNVTNYVDFCQVDINYYDAQKMLMKTETIEVDSHQFTIKPTFGASFIAITMEDQSLNRADSIGDYKQKLGINCDVFVVE